jgi:hypothetical protein
MMKQDKIIQWLEQKGYSFVSYNEEESTSSRLLFRGEDERGFFLEFLYTPADGWLMDREVGSKYFDTLEKVAV